MAKVMNVVFGIGVAVIFYLVVLLGIQAFYPEPQYEDYDCYSAKYVPVIEQSICLNNITKEECLAQEKEYRIKQEEQAKKSEECNKRYEDANKVYGKNLFIIVAIIGAIFVTVSYFLFSMVNISAGIAFAGLSLIIYGFARGWNSYDHMLKFILGLIAAIIVIFFAVKINKKYQQEKSLPTQ